MDDLTRRKRHCLRLPRARGHLAGQDRQPRAKIASGKITGSVSKRLPLPSIARDHARACVHHRVEQPTRLSGRQMTARNWQPRARVVRHLCVAGGGSAVVRFSMC